MANDGRWLAHADDYEEHDRVNGVGIVLFSPSLSSSSSVSASTVVAINNRGNPEDIGASENICDRESERRCRVINRTSKQLDEQVEIKSLANLVSYCNKKNFRSKSYIKNYNNYVKIIKDMKKVFQHFMKLKIFTRNSEAWTFLLHNR